MDIGEIKEIGEIKPKELPILEPQEDDVYIEEDVEVDEEIFENVP